MPQVSSIKRLPPEVKAAIDAALKSGRFTLDEILEQVRETFGSDIAPSRSALGRYKQGFDAIAKDLRESREIADVWAARLGDAPESDIGKVVQEILRTLSYRVGADMLSGETEVTAKELARLAKAMQYVEDAGRLSLAREKQVRQAATEAAAEEAKAAATAAGLSADKAEAIRRRVLKGQL